MDTTNDNLEKSWQEEIRFAFKTFEELESFLDFPLPRLENYPIFIPRSFAQILKEHGPNSVLAKEFLPDQIEADDLIQKNGLKDPIGDENHSKAKQIIHRYKNRVLFLPTTKCPINCRYCFRKNELFTNEEIFRPGFKETIEYLNNHPGVNEIIFSGGDPLFLGNSKIDMYLSEFEKIPHIKYIRFHTRFPIILPQRLDEELTAVIQKYEKRFTKINFVLHVNHIDELYPEVKTRILKSKLNWLSQGVLLKGVNDDPKTLIDLYYTLDELNIRPYYLHHPDHVKGAMHFYLPLEEGRKIYRKLRRELPGWLIPEYVLDIPKGVGKTSAFNPESIMYNGKLLDLDANLVDITLND